MADDKLPANFHLRPFSRFAGIHVSVQFGAKTQGWATFRRKFRDEGVNCRQLRLVRWVDGAIYRRDQTLIALLI